MQRSCTRRYKVPIRVSAVQETPPDDTHNQLVGYRSFKRLCQLLRILAHAALPGTYSVQRITDAPSASMGIHSSGSSIVQPLAHSSWRPSQLAVWDWPRCDFLRAFCDDVGGKKEDWMTAVVEGGEPLVAISDIIRVFVRRY